MSLGRSVLAIPHVSRRQLLGGVALLSVGAAWPDRSAVAAPAPKYRRLNISDPATPSRVIDSYKRAIRAMLALPPEDPRNWYRHALVHALDCPHGNWWFLPWHRAYLGWFERTCRELSGDPDFALPYWDWTKEPSVPAAMFEDVLTPTHAAFMDTYEQFNARFKTAVAGADWWKATYKPNGDFDTGTRYGQLLSRSIRFPDDLWFDISVNPTGPYYFDRAHGRASTPGDATLDEDTRAAVALPALIEALSPRDFTTFGSAATASHGSMTGFGILEGGPHNLVHNCVGGADNGKGGFMQGSLSPVDPLFFLHHANIDRLWDVWTRKQAERNDLALPAGAPATPGGKPVSKSDYARWAAEPFLFFTQPDGKDVTQTEAGDYAAIGAFDYDYAPGSGEEVVAPQIAAMPLSAKQTFSALALTRSLAAPRAGGTLGVPSALILSAASGNTQPLLARITLALPSASHRRLHVFLNAPGDARQLSSDSPFFAGTLAMFGHHTMAGNITFTVPLHQPLQAMQARSALVSNAGLTIQVVPRAMAMSPGMTMGSASSDDAGDIVGIVIES